MRAGELCGLRVEDVNLEERVITVAQSVWAGKRQTPKTQSAIRSFAISERLAEHLRRYLGS